MKRKLKKEEEEQGQQIEKKISKKQSKGVNEGKIWINEELREKEGK